MRASRNAPRGNRVGIVVLGYPARRDGTPHAIVRWRVQTAVDLARRHDADVVVMSGGPTRGDIVEADVMVVLARQLGVDDARLRAERTSMNTWQNVRESARFVRDCDAVLLVSDAMHARRARRYWHAQFPEDVDRVDVARDRTPLTRWWLLVPVTVSECAIAVHDRVRSPLC